MLETVQKYGMEIGGKVVGAIILWVVGRWAIGMIGRLLGKSLGRQKFDPTLVKYCVSAATVLLNVLLVIAVLGVFGVQTTTFAGILAAAGVAIGMAWSGLLSNFAAGIFMIVLRPFKVGDYVVAGEVEGTVEDIGLFVTSITSPDNVLTFIGNGKVFGGTIKNFSAHEYRRVDITAQLPHTADVAQMIESLKKRLAEIPNVKSDPAPVVTVLTFTLAGPVLAVRPFCHTAHYWDVYFATNQVIIDACGAADLPAPTTNYKIFREAA